MKKDCSKRMISFLLIISMIFVSVNCTPIIALASENCEIKDVFVDMANYSTGDTAEISIEINNSSDTLVSKVVNTNIYHLEKLVEKYSTVVNINPNGVTTHELDWKVPNKNYQGYLVTVDLGDGVKKTTAIDVSNDFTRYPRYGYSVDFPVGETEAESDDMIEKLSKDYHINVVQYYDWMYRHEQNFPTTGTTWNDLFGNTISENAIKNRIDKGHELNQKALAYQMAYMVREGYENNGAKKEWGLYKNKDYNINYNPNDQSTINNIDQLNFPLEGNPNPILLAMNPANKEWQKFMAGQNVNAINRLSFDGIQIDQMGDFWGTIDKFDYWGNYVDLGKTFSDFVNETKSILTKNNSNKNYLTMNIVNGAVPPNDNFSTSDIVNNANTDFAFSEIWQNSSTYNSLKSYIEWEKLKDKDKTMVLAAYMNQHDNLGDLYEAENAKLSGVTSGVDSGTTYVTGYDDVGDYSSFEVTVPEDGDYTLVFRFSNGSSNRVDKNIYVDNSKVLTAYFDLTRTGLVPANPSWSNYSYEAAFTDPKTLFLTKGKHTIKVQHDEINSGDIRLDSLTLGSFNKASVRLTDAVIAASGAMHIEMGTGLSVANDLTRTYTDTVMLGHPYYPKAFKMMQNDLREEMKSHYDFITAYENLLYDPDVIPVDGGNQNINIKDEEVSGSGEQGKIWFIPKTKKDDYGILHLINLTGENNTNWRDSTAEPVVKKNLKVKYYIPYNKSISQLYMTSPDRNSCESESLAFVNGIDKVGKFIEFTVDELKYWDMIYYKFGNENEPYIYEAESSIKSGVNVNTNHKGYTGNGFVDGYGDLYDSVTFDIKVDVEDDYTLEFAYANATGEECSRQLFVDNQDKGKISYQPLSNWDTWGEAEKGIHLLPGRHRLVVLVTNDYGGAINLDNLKVTKLIESTRSAYMNNWKDTVYIWKDTQINGAQALLSDGPGIYELRHYESTKDDDYNINQIKNYSMFFRNETDNKVYTQGSEFRSTGYYGEDGVFYSDYETYEDEELSPNINRAYAVVPNQKFMIVKYTIENNTNETKKYNIMDMLHVNNEIGKSKSMLKSTTEAVIKIDTTPLDKGKEKEKADTTTPIEAEKEKADTTTPIEEEKEKIDTITPIEEVVDKVESTTSAVIKASKLLVGENEISAVYSEENKAITIDMTALGQYYLGHGTLEDSIDGYQIADDSISDILDAKCSPWGTFNSDGTLKNNGSIVAKDVSTAYAKTVTLEADDSQDLYFYLAIGETSEEINEIIATAKSHTGDYWMSNIEEQYNQWLEDGKTTNFDDESLNDAYSNISIALKQAIVPGKYDEDGNSNVKYAALPATTNPSAYSYKVWARDSAVTAMSLDASGHLDEAEDYWFWLADRQIKSDEGGWKKPGTFWTCYWIWDNSAVTFVEPEYDSIGMFLVGAYRHYENLTEPKKTQFLNNIWDSYKMSADFVLNNIQSNGFGVADCSIWEEQSEYNAFTEALYVAGLDAAQAMAKAKGIVPLADKYNGAAGTIRSAIQRSSTDSQGGLWNQTDSNNRYYNRAVNLDGTPRTTVDSSSDVLITYGVIDMMSKRAYDHYNKVISTISHDDYGITRYEGDTFYTGKNSWDPGGVEAFEDEPSWPQMSMWAAQMEIYSGYDALYDNALRRLKWFVSRTAKGYAPQGEAVSNVTLKPMISTMIEPITGASYIMTALAYLDEFDMRILPEQYNAGARGTISVNEGCVDKSNKYKLVSDWSQWKYIPYYLDEVGDNSAGNDTRDIEKVYICNDDENIYIRVDNVGNILPKYNDPNDKFMMAVYSEDFSNGSVNKTNNSFNNVKMDRNMSYMLARWSDGSNYSKFDVDSKGDWAWEKNVTDIKIPEWEMNSGRFEMVIPINEVSSGSASNGDWANMKVSLGYNNGSGMHEVDFMNLHYRLTGSGYQWIFGNSEQ